MAGSPQLSQLLDTGVGELVVFNLEHIDFLALDVRSSGSVEPIPPPGNELEEVLYSMARNDFSFLDWVGDAEAVAGYAVAFGAGARPFEALAGFAAVAAVVEGFEPAGGLD